MNIKEYCHKNKVTITELARRAGYSRPRFSALIHSDKPHSRFIKVIESITDGQVNASDWYPDIIKNDPNQLELF